MKRFSQSLLTVASILVLFGASSCNRGYGCPTNFSFNEILSDVVNLAINLLF